MSLIDQLRSRVEEIRSKISSGEALRSFTTREFPIINTIRNNIKTRIETRRILLIPTERKATVPPPPPVRTQTKPVPPPPVTKTAETSPAPTEVVKKKRVGRVLL